MTVRPFSSCAAKQVVSTFGQSLRFVADLAQIGRRQEQALNTQLAFVGGCLSHSEFHFTGNDSDQEEEGCLGVSPTRSHLLFLQLFA